MTTAESNAPRSRLIRYPPAGTPTPAEQNQNPSVAESPYTFPCLRAAATHRRKVVHFAPTMLDTSPLLANQKGKFPSPNTAERSLSPRPATFRKEILNLEQRLPSGRKRRPIRSIQTARTLSPSTAGTGPALPLDGRLVVLRIADRLGREPRSGIAAHRRESAREQLSTPHQILHSCFDPRPCARGD